MSRPGILLAGEPAFVVAERPSLLSLHNPEFILTTSGREAFLLVLKHRPRLAIVGDVLPDMAADDLFGLVRADRDLRRMSLVQLASREQGESRHANAVMDIGSLDPEALAERADRLLSVPQRIAARASVCVGRRQDRAPASSFAHTVNLSESGMLLACREELDLGERVWLHFVLPHRPELIAAQGEVVRQALLASHSRPHRPAPVARPAAAASQRFGLEFTAILPHDQLRIRQFVESSAAA